MALTEADKRRLKQIFDQLDYHEQQKKAKMGKMTDEEKRRVVKMLDELDRSQLDKVLASVSAFGNWLSKSAYSIYCKVKDALRSLWQSICNFFS